MAFLTQKEQSMINMVQLKDDLLSTEKAKFIQRIMFNAKLRQDNFRPIFKKFFGAITSFKSDNLYKKLSDG